MCGVNQLSPGAYLLREDLFPAIVAVRWRRLHLSGLADPQIAVDQRAGDGEIHVRGAPPACTVVQLSQVGRCEA